MPIFIFILYHISFYFIRYLCRSHAKPKAKIHVMIPIVISFLVCLFSVKEAQIVKDPRIIQGTIALKPNKYTRNNKGPVALHA